MPEDGKGLASVRLRDLAWTALTAIGLAVLMRVFVLGTFVIPSESMTNTLLPGDNILVSKLPALLGGIELGDVVVFTLPDSLRGNRPDEPFIKRVIGLPGDTVVLTPDGIAVNNHLLPHPPESAFASPTESGPKTFFVPADCYFLLGDNRANSWDSRYWGPLPKHNIVGKPLFIYWSRGSTQTDSTVHFRWDRFLRAVE
jgi:signal peptidase I